MAIELPDGRSESNDVLEALRLRAVHARQLGYAVVDIAAILGVREETVSRWCSRYDRGGQEALPGDRTGRPIGSGRSSPRNRSKAIQQAIETKTPQELGIPSALWTRQAVRELIKQQVGIRLPIRTVGEYLRRWGFTPQKPVRKAYKQDPEAVAEWLEKTYPEIERRAAKEGGEIHWGDETGVRSTCQHSRGYARPGDDPGVDRAREPVQREHDLDDHQSGEGAVDDLHREDERRVVHRVPDAVDRGGDEEGVPDRGSPERA